MDGSRRWKLFDYKCTFSRSLRQLLVQQQLELTKKIIALYPDIGHQAITAALSIIQEEVEEVADSRSKYSRRWHTELEEYIPLLVQTLKIARDQPQIPNLEMPFVDRDEQTEKFKQFCWRCVWSYQRGYSDKTDYGFAVLTSGTGKTRFCQEIPNLIKGADSIQHSEKYSMPQTIITVHVDCKEAMKLLDLEEKMSPENFLGICVAAHVLFNCSISKLLESLGEQAELSELLELYPVMKLIAKKNNATEQEPIGVVIILDQLEYLYKKQSFAEEVIHSLAWFMKCDNRYKQRELGIILFPVLSGNTPLVIWHKFRIRWFYADTFELTLFSFNSIRHIFNQCVPSKQHWLRDKKFLRLLVLYGCWPSYLQSIINLSSQLSDDLSDENFNTICAVAVDTSTFMERIAKLSEIEVRLLCDLALTGRKISPHNDIINSIEREGLLYEIDNRCILPYAFILALNNKVKSIPQHLLPVPGAKYTWQELIELEQYLQVVRHRLDIQLEESIQIGNARSAWRGDVKKEHIRLNKTPVKCIQKIIGADGLIDLNNVVVEGLGRLQTQDLYDYSIATPFDSELFDIVEVYQKGEEPIVALKKITPLKREKRAIKKWKRRMWRVITDPILFRRSILTTEDEASKKCNEDRYDWPGPLVVPNYLYGPMIAKLVELINIYKVQEKQ